MNLSYLLRLLCLLVVVIGAIHALVQMVLAACARPLLRLLGSVSSRTRERALYLLQIAPLPAGLFFAGALCMPQYLRLEPSSERESVSLLCLLLAASVVLWFGVFAFRGLRIALRTHRFVRDVSRSARASVSHGRLPVLTLREAGPLIALVGFFRPSVLVSRSLLAGEVLDTAALALVLDHESSHAAHRDNWKLLSLRLLPGFGFNPWLHPWQAAAEWAADDDAVCGDPARRLLLAETLVRVARSGPASRPPILHTAFMCREEELASRVGRLLGESAASRPVRRSLVLAGSGFALSLLAAAVVFSPWVYALSESILHLG